MHVHARSQNSVGFGREHKNLDSKRKEAYKKPELQRVGVLGFSSCVYLDTAGVDRTPHNLNQSLPFCVVLQSNVLGRLFQLKDINLKPMLGLIVLMSHGTNYILYVSSYANKLEREKEREEERDNRGKWPTPRCFPQLKVKLRRGV